MKVPRIVPRSSPLGFSVVAALLAFTSLTAPAAVIGPTDSFIVYDPSGNVFASVFADEISEATQTVYYIPILGLADPSQINNPTYLLEPDGSFSDVFGVGTLTTDVFVLAFASDSETGLPVTGTQGIFLPEGNGGPFDATMYLNPTLRTQGYTAKFQSDAEPGANVPDRSNTFGLFGVALMGLAVLHRKRISLRPQAS